MPTRMIRMQRGVVLSFLPAQHLCSLFYQQGHLSFSFQFASWVVLVHLTSPHLHSHQAPRAGMETDPHHWFVPVESWLK